jgi:hypothetical protein
MKAPLITMTILLLAVTARSQVIKKPGSSGGASTSSATTTAAYRQQLFVTGARALPGLYQKKDFDSISYYIQLRWQPGPIDPDLLCQAILLSIQRDIFSLTDFSDKDDFTWPLIAQLRAYADNLVAARNSTAPLCYHARPGFDPTTVDKELFSTTAGWAADLLQTHTLDSAETFLCHVFAGDIRYPDHFLWQHRGESGELAIDDAGTPVHQRPQPRLHKWGGVLTIGAGTWFPAGHLSVLGAHPAFNYGFGARNRLNEWDLDASLRFASAPQPYTIVRNDTVFSRTYYQGGYAGLHYTRYLVHGFRWETGVTGGFGLDAIDVASDGNTDAHLSPQEIYSFDYNLGIRCNYYFHPHFFVGITAKYHFLNYSNPGGSSFDGNAVTLDITIGCAGNRIR